MKKVFLIFFVFICLASFAEVDVSVSLSQDEVYEDEHVVLQLRIENGNGDEEIRFPKTDFFSVNSSGTSRQTSIVNGSMSQAVIYNYLLYPVKPGEFKFPEIKVIANGREFSTRPFTIRVLAANEQKNEGVKTAGLQVQLKLDKETVYVDEPVILRFLILKPLNLPIRNAQYELPKFLDFVTEKGAGNEYRKQINGVLYDISEISTILYPSKTGVYELGPGILSGQIIEKKARSRRRSIDSFFDDPFDDFFFGGDYSFIPFKKQSNRVSINVKSLPAEGKPENFSGTVGSYVLNVQYSNLGGVKKGDAVTVTMEVEGAGHLPAISEPDLVNADNFKQFEAEVKIESLSGNNMAGKKVFKKIVIPEKPGKYNLPDVEFSFFDPVLEKYVKLKKEGPEISVKNSEESTNVEIFKGPSSLEKTEKEELKFTGFDIIFINTDPDILKSGERPIAWNMFFGTLGMILVVFLGAMGILLYREKNYGNEKLRNRRQAFKKFQKELKKSRSMSCEKIESYELLSEGISMYLSHATGNVTGTWTLYDIDQKLPQSGISESHINALKELIEQLDMVRYGKKTMSEEKWNQYLISVEKAVQEVDKCLK